MSKIVEAVGVAVSVVNSTNSLTRRRQEAVTRLLREHFANGGKADDSELPQKMREAREAVE